MSEENVTAGTGKRPGFLTVLCILTFIGSGLGVLGGLLGLIGSSLPGVSMFVSEGTMIVQILGLAAAALCLFGAIQMWGLKKQGFMMYLMGAVLGIVGSIVSALTITSYMKEAMGMVEGIEGMDDAMSDSMSMIGDSMMAAAQAAAWTGVAVAVVINLAFVLMYNANKKHLVN